MADSLLWLKDGGKAYLPLRLPFYHNAESDILQIKRKNKHKSNGICATRNHESLCRGGPPLAADGAAMAHLRASTVRATVRACDAVHRRRFQRTQKPRFAGTQNGASATRLHEMGSGK